MLFGALTLSRGDTIETTSMGRGGGRIDCRSDTGGRREASDKRTCHSDRRRAGPTDLAETIVGAVLRARILSFRWQTTHCISCRSSWD